MRRILLLFLFLAATGVHADGQMEILHLKHRAAEDVIEVLRPLVEQGGSIGGLRDKIIVRASASNRAQIRAALAAVDTAPRRLMITVKQDNTASGQNASGSVSGSLGRGGNHVRSRVWTAGASYSGWKSSASRDSSWSFSSWRC